MIIDHANDQRAGDYVVAEMAEKQKVNAVVSAAVENAKRQNKRINDRSDDHDVITRAHRTLRDRLERDTLDDDGERFEFEAGDYLIDNVEARKAGALCCVGPGPMFWKPLFLKSLFLISLCWRTPGYVYSPGAGNARSAKDDDEGTPPEYRIASMLNSCSAQISSLINTIYSIRNNYRKKAGRRKSTLYLWGKLALLSWHTNESVKITGQCWKRLNSSRRMEEKCRP